MTRNPARSSARETAASCVTTSAQSRPIFDAASEKHGDITFAKVDTEAERELAGAAGIRSIPTLMAFRDGVLVFSQPGALPADTLEQVIAAVRGLDMDDVRRQVAERTA